MSKTINLESYRKRNREEQELEKSLYVIALGVELLEILSPVDADSIKFVTGALIDRAEILADVFADPEAIKRKRNDFSELVTEYTRRAEALQKKYEINKRKEQLRP